MSDGQTNIQTDINGSMTYFGLSIAHVKKLKIFLEIAKIEN